MKTGHVSERLRRCLLLALATLACLAASLAAAAPAELSLIYWSAGDCGPCKAWSQTERKQEFLAEAKALGVKLVEVQRPRLADPLSRYQWPKEETALMQSYLSRQYPPAKLTPAFDFVCRGEMMLRLDGLAEWDSFWKRNLRRQAKLCKESGD